MIIEKEKVDAGFSYAVGVGKYIAITLLLFVFLSLIIGIFDRVTGVRLNDTDESASKRSGLKLHTDYGTGVQYLSDGKGGLIVRQQK